MTFDVYGHPFPAPEHDKVAIRQLQARCWVWVKDAIRPKIPAPA
jgi:hypothetical protein